MTSSNLQSVDLTHFLVSPSADPVLNRRPRLLRFVIACYALFCCYIYLLLLQLVKRNRQRSQAQNRKKGASVEFEEEVLIVEIKGEERDRGWQWGEGDVRVGKLKA